ncbi:MAG: bifunctional alpha/beta hydrolase/OsmC family protein [Planctomycetota bacterium]
MTKFDFTNRDGKQLSGRIELPAGRPEAFAIFAHCFTCSKNSKAATLVSRRLAGSGIAVLRFDFTGLGNSEGDFASTSFSSNVNDLIDAASALEQQCQAPSLLIGHSLGGTAVVMAAPSIKSSKAVVTIGAPGEPAHVENLVNKTTTTSHADGSLTIRLGGRDLTLGSHFIDDLKSNRLTQLLPDLGKALMIFHSPVDEIVSIENARKLYESARHPKSFVSVDGAAHMLNDSRDAEFVADTLAAWATRYLLEPSGEASQNPDETAQQLAEPGTVVVVEQSGLTQSVRTERHSFIADEPVDLGGCDLGPNPYELLLASLGACTSMTLRMYARRKNLQLDSISIKLKHSRIHASDCDSCETESGRIDRIEKEIVISGILTPAQVKRLGEIADLCPVHRTLTSEKIIESKIKQATD